MSFDDRNQRNGGEHLGVPEHTGSSAQGDGALRCGRGVVVGLTRRELRQGSFALAAVAVLLGACGGNVTVDAPTGAGGATAGSATGTTGSAMTDAVSTGTVTTGGGGPFDACAQPGSCTLVAKQCCGVCGAPTLADVAAVAKGMESGYRDSVCPAPGTPCPACAEQPNPNLFAVCNLDAKRCVAQELGTSAFAECTTAEDCTLRRGLGCCTCSFEPGIWVAVAKGKLGALADAVCAPEQACDLCEPEPPIGMGVACEGGHCATTQNDSPPPP